MISASHPAQFIFGRVISYYMAGFTVTLLPTYLAETAPAELRGWVSSQIQFMLVFGVTVAGLVNLGTSRIDTNASWQISTGTYVLRRNSLFFADLDEASCMLCHCCLLLDTLSSWSHLVGTPSRILAATTSQCASN